jgi:subtilisin family serine protease
MATPHLAGAAAVVRGVHPDWTAAQVRSAIVNTAQEGLLRHPATGAVTADVQIVGAGLLDVRSALAASAGLDPVSVSFGAISPGSGGRRTGSIVITNLTGAQATYAISLADDASDGVTFGVSPASVTLAPGASATIGLTAVAQRSIADGPRQAFVRVSTGGVEVAHAAVFALVGSGDQAPGQHMLPPPFA